MPTESALERFYGGYYESEHIERRGSKITHDNPQRMARHLAGFAEEIQQTDAISILDFGGGDGTLGMLTAFELLKSKKVKMAEVTVVDRCGERCEPIDERITLRTSETLDEINRTDFDYVIASGVLEHIPDAPTVLPKVLSCVGKNGIFYARTPQVLSFMRLSNASPISWDFYFPAHVYDLGQVFWENYFRSEERGSLFSIMKSTPSIVETSLSVSPITAILSHALKSPWYLFGRAWGFVGGWEIVVHRR
ncbi:MAG: hypothetical protein SynsKO_07710 [Synoicihabitans sp.]